MDIKLALMCGIDIPIPELQLVIHQPKIKEIAYIGTKDFFVGVQSICINKNNLNIEAENVLSNTSNFQIFMTMMQEKEMADKKLAVNQVFTLLFPNQKVLLTPRSILVQGAESIMIDESNFESLQMCLKQIFCLNNSDSQQMGFNPQSKKAKEIAEKLMRGRQRIAEQNGEADADIFSQYLSTLAIGLQMPLSELMDCTVYQLFDLIKRYQLYIDWDIDIRSRLAGAKPDGKPENWMKNIH